jgi:cell division septation protein DedD
MSHKGRFFSQLVRQSEGKGDGGGSFTDPVFDDEYYGRDKDDGKGRTIGLAIGVVIGAVIAGFAAWTVFAPGSGRDTAEAPLIVPQPEPYKVRPENPGGMQVENQDKLVYERLGGEAPQPEAENILPPPETPKVPEAPPVVQAPAAPEPAPVQLQAVEAPAPEPPAPPAVTEVPAPEITQDAAAPQPGPIASPIASPDSVPPAAPEQDPFAAAVAAISGDYLIQIAALRSEEVAQAEWQRVSSRYPTLLGGLKPVIVRADLGERGIFYRLRAGPLADRVAADTLCESLAAENVGCLVVRNE